MAYKLCSKCGLQCGVRSKRCECGEPFPVKTKREKALVVRTEQVNWNELRPGDRIKVVSGYGPWMMVGEQKHYTGVPGGLYDVVAVHDTGIRVRDNTGYAFAYMGKDRPSITGGVLTSHKIKLVKRKQE